jgi:hypothetical protein
MSLIKHNLGATRRVDHFADWYNVPTATSLSGTTRGLVVLVFVNLTSRRAMDTCDRPVSPPKRQCGSTGGLAAPACGHALLTPCYLS